MNEKDDWPTAEEMHRPDSETVKGLIATYVRVVRNELPPQQRSEFQIRPEDRLRRVFGSEAQCAT